MPFAEDQIEDALREAYASAPTTDSILYTLELRHSAFVDDLGAATHIRLVANARDFNGKLEASAEVQAGATVPFVGCGFQVDLPEQTDQALPEATLSIDNVTRLMVPQLDRTIDTVEPIKVVYREYLRSRIAIGPSYVIRGLRAKRVMASTFRVSAKVGFLDFINRAVPLRNYRPEIHRGIAR